MRKLSPDQEVLLCSKYQNFHLSIGVLALEFGVSYATAFATLQRHNIPRRKMSEAVRRYAVDETAFDRISAASAYWAGFLMADGFVGVTRKRFWYFGLRLNNKDHWHVLNFRRFLKAHHPIRLFPNNSTGIVISSKRLTTRLGELGITSRKSLTATAHGELLGSSNFWRGVIDGDGHISFNKKGIPVLQLCGSQPLMTQYCEWVREVIPGYSPKVLAHGRIFAVWLAGRFAVQVVRALYDHSAPEIRLARKYQMAQRALLYTWKSKNYMALP